MGQQSIRQFFEKDQESKKKFGKGKILILIGCVAFIFCLFKASIKPKKAIKENLPTESQEERKDYTEEEINKFFEDKENAAAEKEAQEKRVQRQKVNQTDEKKQEIIKAIPQRDLKKDMGIYIFREKEVKVENIEFQQKEEKQTIGLSSGATIPAILANTIFSFNVESPVIALLTEDYIKDEKVLLSKDTQFLGEASVVKSLDRVNVNFHRMVFPDGKEVPVRAIALSLDGSGGIPGKIEKHRGVRFFKALGETLLAGASLFAGKNNDQPFSLEDQIRLNAAQNLASEAQKDLRSVKVDTSVTVNAYTPIRILFLEAI